MGFDESMCSPLLENWTASRTELCLWNRSRSDRVTVAVGFNPRVARLGMNRAVQSIDARIPRVSTRGYTHAVAPRWFALARQRCQSMKWAQ